MNNRSMRLDAAWALRESGRVKLPNHTHLIWMPCMRSLWKQLTPGQHRPPQRATWRDALELLRDAYPVVGR